MTITRSRTLKQYAFENIQVGEEFGPVEGVLSELKVKTHAFAVDDYGAWYFQSSPFGGRVGHPTLLANDILMLFTLGYDMTPPCEAGLHARNELEFLRPIFIGQKVTIKGKHTEKYQKRAQSYRILEGQVLDEAGHEHAPPGRNNRRGSAGRAQRVPGRQVGPRWGCVALPEQTHHLRTERGLLGLSLWVG